MRRAKKGLAILASTVLMVTSAVNYHGLTFSTNVYSEETSNAETMSESEMESTAAQVPTEVATEMLTEASAVETQAEATPVNVEVPEQSEAQEVTVQEIAAQDTTQETVVAETIAPENSIENAEKVVETETELLEDETEEEVEIETETETETSEEENSKVETEEEMSEEETEVEDEIAVMSLLPLEEVTAYLDIKGKTRKELYSMTIDEVLDSLQDLDGNKISIPENATTAWRKIHSWYNELEDYVEYPLGQNAEFDPYGDSKLELIVGSKNQLDKNNKRYLITVVGTTYNIARNDNISYELYVQDGSGERTQIVSESVVERNVDFRDELNDFTLSVSFFTKISVDDPDYWSGKEYYLGLCSTAAIDSDLNINVYTYEEYLKKLHQENAKTCTNQILNLDMTQRDSGMKGTYEYNPNNNASRIFCVEYSDQKGEYSSEVGVVEFSVVSDTFQIENSSLYRYNGSSAVDATSYKYTNYRENDLYVNGATGKEEYFDHIEEETFGLREGYSISDVYYKINAKGGTSSVIKAVKGLYKSLEQATGQPDIKEQLISADTDEITGGCKVNESGNGGFNSSNTYFTIFGKNGFVLNVCVTVRGYEMSTAYWNDTVNGKEDPWFQIRGVKQNNEEISAFIVQNGLDTNLYTMYGYGYQTVLIQDESVDLSQLQPIWTVDSGCVTKVAVNGQEVKSGQVIDCSSGSVQYTIIVNGHQKNYQVNFVKATSKAKLFVAGPQTQEVIFNSTSGMHDIFIANLGQEELTGLRVELNATNCALDDYWTVGGENNDTLAPFDSVATNTQNGILNNAAKIRLIASDTSGAIQGTLTIYADGLEPVVINLIGYSKDPRIVTNGEEFSKVAAIKYVPYSYMITTDNMYDWLDVSYELTSGALPKGVELYPETGEIYGVPEEAGTFDIGVTAKFISKKTSRELSSSTVRLVLTVEENTAENVFKASSEGYEIKQALGTDMGDYNFVLTSFEDAVFVSYGEFSEYCGVWLNGNRLEEGKDYDAESGSTRITIHGETFENTDYVNQDGENTIAIEFRKGGDRNEELKRTSQNFTINATKPSEPESKPTVEPTTTEPTKSTVAPTTEEPTEKVTTAEATTKEAPTTVTKSEEPKSTVSSTETPETAATAKENETSASATETTAASVKCTVKMVDAENKAIDNLNLELHSTPQKALTDENGCAAFDSIEFGSHMLYVKNTDGTTEGSISFTITEGNSLALNGNVITAPNGANFILTVRYDQNNLELVSVHDNAVRSSEIILGIEDYAEWIGAFLFGVGIAMAMYLCVYAISNAIRRRR